MQLIDYKITSVNRNGKTVATIRAYTGAITTEDELHDGVLIPVTRYRRTKLVSEEVHELDGVKASDKVREHLDLRLKDIAATEKATPIDVQKISSQHNER